MSYLPTEIQEKAKGSVSTTKEKYKDFYYDETNNRLTGQLSEGANALKGWIYFALKTARYRYPIFSYFYGCELETLISKTIVDNAYLVSEARRMIEDALLINPHIESVKDVEVEKVKEKMNISCIVNTEYGDVYVKI